ncbi:MAG: 4Fe-4S dicluster domain-containing protein [Anaerolineales bacterium]|nr:4Fe-4S dicluster domain-containing protein [Anaerolineales bacterium]
MDLTLVASTIVRLLIGLVGIASFGFLAVFCITSLKEKERRASLISFFLALIIPFLFLAVELWNLWPGPVLIITGLMLLFFLLPIGQPTREDITPTERVDERDIMFARARLVPESAEYRDYYKRHPERKSIDDRIRNAPGLLGPGSNLYHPLAMPTADASFTSIEALHDVVDGPAAETRLRVDPVQMTRFIKGLAGFYGASAAGVTELKEYHVYTHVGREPGHYGDEIQLDHKYAIALTVEMSHTMMRTAPAASETMEVAKAYFAAAAIAVQLAVLIRSLGYPARAHIDGNYRVICPLLARDSGLGEIGRMGLLMTPGQGPRVRISVVTTDLPLIPDEPKSDPTLIDFCTRCKKCIDNCPSKSIPTGSRQDINGVKRWRINSETCFHYWNVIGTDCGRCISVCPYSHPDSALHQMVRWFIRRSPAARLLALKLDDLFYGRRPQPGCLPDWLPQFDKPPARH